MYGSGGQVPQGQLPSASTSHAPSLQHSSYVPGVTGSSAAPRHSLDAYNPYNLPTSYAPMHPLHSAPPPPLPPPAKSSTLTHAVRDLKLQSALDSYASFQQSLHKELYKIALEHWAHKEYLKCFRSWRYIVADRLNRFHHLESFRLFRKKSTLFHAWRWALGWRRRIHALTIYALEHWAHQHTAKAFDAFRQRIHDLHEKETILFERKLRRIFSAWFTSAALRRNAIERYQIVSSRVQRNARRRFFMAYKQAMWSVLTEREIIRQVQLIHLRGAWLQWRTARYYNALEARIRQRSMQARLVRAYAEWRYGSLLARIAVQWRTDRYSRALLRRWRDSIQRSKRLTKMVIHADSFSLRQVWHSWRHMYRQHIWHRHADRFQLVSNVRLHWRSWRRALFEKRKTDMAWMMGAQFHAIHGARHVLTVWRTYARRSAQLKRQAHTLQTIHRFHLLLAAFYHWGSLRELIMEQRAHEARARAHEMHYRMRQAMLGWADIIRRKYGRHASNQLRMVQHDRGGALTSSMLYSPAASMSANRSTSYPAASSAIIRLGDASSRQTFVPFHAKASMSDMFYARRLFRQVMDAWKEETLRGREIDKVNVPLSNLFYVQHLIRSWHAVAMKSHRLHQATRAALGDTRRSLLVDGYNTWVGTFNLLQALRKQEASVIQLQLRRRWVGWQVVFKLRRNLTLKRRWIEVHQTMRKGWNAWRSNYHSHLLLHSVLTRLHDRWLRIALHRWAEKLALELRFRKFRHLVVKRARFLQWREHASLRQQLRQLVHTWSIRRPRSEMHDMFHHWRSVFLYRMESVQRAHLHRLHHVMSLWQRRAHWARYDRRVIETFAERRTLRRMLQVWSGWRQQLMDQRMEWHNSRRIAVHQWLRRVADSKKEVMMRKYATRFLRQRRLQRGIYAFLTHAARRQHVRLSIHLARHHYAIRHLQSQTFAAWLRYVRSTKLSQITADAFHARVARQRMWARIREKVASRQRVREVLNKIVPWTDRPLHNAALQHWRAWTEEHRLKRMRHERFMHIVAARIYDVWQRKLLAQSLHDWRVAYAIHVRCNSLGTIIAVNSARECMRRAWLDWSLHIRATRWLSKRLQVRAIHFLRYRAMATATGEKLKARTQASKARGLMMFWLAKTRRILLQRVSAAAFKKHRVTDAMLRQCYNLWRHSYLLLTGALADIRHRRHESQMRLAIARWIDTLNSRNVYRWAVALFKQKLAAIQDHEMHRLREQRACEHPGSMWMESGPFDIFSDEQAQMAASHARPIPDDELRRELDIPTVLSASLAKSRGVPPPPPAVTANLPPALSQQLEALPPSYRLTVGSLNKIVHRWRTLDLTIPFMQWLGVLRARKEAVASWNKAVTHSRLHTLTSSFRCWGIYIRRVRRVKRALEMGRMVVQRHCMYRWMLYRLYEQRLNHAAQQANYACARDAWLVWRYELAWKIRLRHGENVSLQHWARNMIVHHFHAWRSNSRKLRSLAIRHREFTHANLFKLQYRAFAHWLQLYLKSTTHRRRMQLAASHRRMVMLRAMMGRWVLYRQITRAKRAVVEQGWNRTHMRLVAALWHHWRQSYEALHRTKLRLRQLLASRSQRIQSEAMLEWSRVARKLRTDRTTIVLFVRERLHRMVWTRWRQAYLLQVVERRDERTARLHHKLRVQANRMLDALRWWHWSSHRDVMLRDRLAAWESLRFTPRFFHAWSTYVSRRRASWTFYRAHAERKFFVTWFKAYAEKRVLDVAQDTIQTKWNKCGLKMAMQAWRRYARKMKMVRDCARIIVTARAGAPLYAHAPLWAALPSPSILVSPDFGSSMFVVRDEERTQWLEQRARELEGIAASPVAPPVLRRIQRMTDGSKVTQQRFIPRLLPSEEEAASISRAEAALYFPSTPLFDPTVFPFSRRPIHPSHPSPSIAHPASESRGAIPRASVALLRFDEMRRELIQTDADAKPAPTPVIRPAPSPSPSLFLPPPPPSEPSTALVPVVPVERGAGIDDPTDDEVRVVYRSSALLLRSTFTFWLTSAALLSRAQSCYRFAQSRRLLSRFKMFRDHRVESREKNAVASLFRKRQMMRQAFRWWIGGVEAQKNVDEYAAELAQDAPTRMALRNAPRFIERWRERTYQGRLIAHAMSQWQSQSLLYAVSVWHWRAHRQALLRQQHDSLWLRHHSSLLRAKFIEWHTKAVWKSRFDRMVVALERLHGGAALKRWKVGVIECAVESFQEDLVDWRRKRGIQHWRRAIDQKLKVHRAREKIISRVQRRILGTYFNRWCLTQLAIERYRHIEDKHQRLVAGDFFIAWQQAQQLSRDLRRRDEDFTKIIGLRRLATCMVRWRRHQRYRILERRVMHRMMKSVLQDWCRLYYTKTVHEKHVCRKVWRAWMQYVQMRRYLLFRVLRLRELQLSRTIVRAWRAVLRSPAQRAQMEAAAVHVWQAARRSMAGLMFGHWRALTKAKRDVEPIIQVPRPRLSSIKELNTLVASAQVERTVIPPAIRSSSSSPGASASPPPPLPSPSQPLTSPLDATLKPLEDEKETAPLSPDHAPSTALTVTRTTRPPLTAVSTPSRATLASLRTFLHSPPQVGLRVRKEVAGRDDQLQRRRRRRNRMAVDSEEEDEDNLYGLSDDEESEDEAPSHMRSPSGRHTLQVQMSPDVVRTAVSPSSPPPIRRFGRSMHASELAR